MSAGISTSTRGFLGALVLLFVANAAPASDSFVGTLSGGAENPPNASTAAGSVSMVWDGFTFLAVDLVFSGLAANDTVAHIHCCADPPTNIGVAVTFPGFPLGVTSGSYAHSIDLTDAASYNATFVTNFGGGTAAGAAAALLAGLKAGRAYVDIHTTMFPGGEIRSYPLGIFLDGFEQGDPLAWSANVGWS